MTKTSRLHAAWEQIFAAQQFDTTQDTHYITSKEIKTITGEEPRLMAKFDSSKNLPPVLKQHGYFILPLSTRRYVLVRGNGFHALEATVPPKDFTSRITFNLASMGRNKSESQYLDYSHIAGVIEAVIGRGTLYSSIRGREGSGGFGFSVGDIALDVTGSQIEVDLGLEGEDCIVLLEAKSKTPEDFMIRQLYYPYRRFKNLAPHKAIIPVFFTYDSGSKSYNYWVYEFTNLQDYNSLRLVSTHAYTITTANEITASDIYPMNGMYKDTLPQQADDLDKILELVFKVKEDMHTATDFAAYFAFNIRQSHYYSKAAEALGFIDRTGGTYQLTSSGEHVVSLDTQDRNLYFARVISNFAPVKASLDLLKTKGTLTRSDLQQIVAGHGGLSESTVRRRTGTLFAWLRWIGINTGAFTIAKGKISV